MKQRILFLGMLFVFVVKLYAIDIDFSFVSKEKGFITKNQDSTKSKIFGLKISILGDSISTINGGGNANIDENETYWGLLEKSQNCSIHLNAIGGTTISKKGQGVSMSSIKRIKKIASDSDIILIFGGINDFFQDMELGEFGDKENKNTFYGALDFMYSQIMKRNSKARVFHLTPLHTTFKQGGGLIPEFNGKYYLTDYVNAIKKVAQRYGVGIIDTFQNSGITAFNVNQLSDDGVHIKQEGHRMIYNTIISEMNYRL